ncbi:MAG: HAD hydrolase-like protein, partial [Betaproteobacteria bacterium]|nr:HAD hydrolase-like protein [Betaproteobacteria bacterium]
LLEDIAHRFNTELAGVPCIGDSLRDLQAAAAVEGKPVLVLTGKGRQTAANGGLPPHTQTFDDLDEAVKSITQ